MKRITADHIYYVGTINTVLNASNNVVIGHYCFSSVFYTPSGLIIETRIANQSCQKKHNDLGLYPINISVYKNNSLIGAYDSVIELSDGVLMAMENSNLLTDKKRGFILHSKPNVFEQFQTCLKCFGLISRAESAELYRESFKLNNVARQLVINNCGEEPLVMQMKKQGESK